MRIKITDFDIQISAENVCAFLDADKTGELYEEIMDELKEMIPTAYEKIRPVALLGFGSMEGYPVRADGQEIREALFGVYSIGKEMERWSTDLFAAGDYLGGMLVDAMADDYLFQMDEAMQETVVTLCREHGKGIAGRAEAPQDVPMSIQKRAWETVGAGDEGIGIKESFMYDPVKSVCQVYLLDDNVKRYHPEHDCSRCSNVACKRRSLPSVQVRVLKGEEEFTIRALKKEPLLKALREHDLFVPAVCGGRGTCGKCGVRFLKGEIPPSAEDRAFYSEEALRDGYRLACRAYPERACTVILEEKETGDFFVLTDDSAGNKDTGKAAAQAAVCAAIQAAGKAEGAIEARDDRPVYTVAADIGTTTVAVRLLKMPEGIPVDVAAGINRQRAYGADVISRIEASNAGKAEELKKSIRVQLRDALLELMKDREGTVQRMMIGGNSTMIHLLMGYSCQGLGVYPFTPVNISTIHTTGEELFGSRLEQSWLREMEITVCPGVSTFVGGDITAGMYALDFDKQERPCVLIDLGTNGEMAVGCRDRILVTSTAAGPAFEGGNIVCGTGSIPGAICSVELRDGPASVQTIGGKPASGICGTGVIDTVYELKKTGIIDETGLMEEPWFDEGFLLSEAALSDSGREIRFYQKDVRELQLAKSAVRAGLETLLSRYGTSYDEISHIYIAGGFGHQMDVAKAAAIGLLPEECLERILAVGNICLKGVEKALTDRKSLERMEHLAVTAEEVQLSNDRQFQEFYMEYMYFE